MLRAVAIGLAVGIGAYWGRRLAMLFGFSLLIVLPLKAQTTIEGYPKVAMEDSARFLMMHDWDSTMANPYTTERAYCAHVLVMKSKKSGQLLYIVDAVRRNPVKNATQYSAIFSNCGPNEVSIHTHLPATCDPAGNCSPGGWDSYDCEPSITDYKTLYTFGAAFAGILCDRFAVRWYYNPYNSLNRGKIGNFGGE